MPKLSVMAKCLSYPGTGHKNFTVYSDEVVRRFANLKPAAPDFRIYWDNAYAFHHIYVDNKIEMLNIVTECEKAGNPDLYYEVCSTHGVLPPMPCTIALETKSYIMFKLEFPNTITWSTGHSINSAKSSFASLIPSNAP